MIKLNVGEFKEFVMKSTFNYSIDSLKLSFSKSGNLSSAMATQSADVITFFNGKNKVFEDVDVDYTISFMEPKTRLMSLLNLIDEEFAGCKVFQDHMEIYSGKQKHKLYFCSDSIVTALPIESVAERAKVILENTFFRSKITEDIISGLKKIKKIGQRFGFVYFDVRGGALAIETSARGNLFSDSFNIELFGGIKQEDTSICFNFKNISNLLSVIQGNEENFEMGLMYEKEKKGGILTVSSEEEKYFIMSLVEEEKLS